MPLTVSVRNTNPLGDVTVHDPDTGDRFHVKAGAVVEVPPELGAGLLLQIGNWEPVEAATERKTAK